MRPIRFFLATLFVALPAPLASAAVINGDIDLPGDRTHSGSDGALSTGGAIWNAVRYDTDIAGLVDEVGSATAVAVTYLRPPSRPLSPYLEFAALNDLQDTGMTGEGFEIRNLDPGSHYALVVYATMGSVFDLIHGGGNAGGGCSTAPPTYMLPGTLGRDYCRFDDLTPFEVAPGIFGIRLSGLQGAITGFQILGTPNDPGPQDTTAPACSSTLVAGTPAGLLIRIADEESGLADIHVVESENATVNVPQFPSGTTQPVVVTVSAVDPALLARISIAASDVAGNAGACEYEIPAAPAPEGCGTREGCCAEVLGFYRSARAQGGLVGKGPGRSGDAHRRVLELMLEHACTLIQQGANEEACKTLGAALRRTDGRPIPPDFVIGELAPDLAARIRGLQQALGCAGSPALLQLRPLSENRPLAPATWGTIKSLYESKD